MKAITDSTREFLAREISLLGEEKVIKLLNSSVTVAGLGGVGGYVCEMLARAGVGRLALIDFDIVSPSNRNRQIIALSSTTGRKKTDVMLERVSDINPECEVFALDAFITKENAAELLTRCGTGIVVDAIDNVSAKTALVMAARDQGKYIFSSMGTGNKLSTSGYKITDISQTRGCGLARAVRRELRKNGIDRLDVLFSEETITKQNGGERVPSSICYMPSTAGLLISEYIIKKIISDDVKGTF